MKGSARSFGLGTAALPRTIEEVDAAWLTRALSTTVTGLTIERAQVVESLGGACTKLRVAIETNRPDFPPTVIVKGCLEPHSVSMQAAQLREVNAYRHLIPHLPDVQTVRHFFADGDEDRGAMLILEDLDLRGVRCLRSLEPIDDFTLARGFVIMLARLHARWWNDAELGDQGRFAWIPSMRQPRLPHAHAVLSDPKRTSETIALPRGAAIARKLQDGARLIRAFASMIELGHEEATVVAHGDPHLSNLFVDASGGPGLLDWTCFRAPWCHDVSYFIGGALDMVDRRRWEDELLKSYLEALRGSGIAPPDFERAHLAYRQWLMWGLVAWLPNLVAFHSEAQITAMTSRFAVACLDHDTLGLLER